MPKAQQEEFATVDLILGSGAKTRAVDAFALALIKSERQLRRLVTFLIYQVPSFSAGDAKTLRKILAANSKIYFEGVERGFNALYSHAVSDLIGDQYPVLRQNLKDAGLHRNKIFHGQVTLDGLSREQLLTYIEGIRAWCTLLATGAESELGFEGFGDSFQKSEKDIHSRLKLQIESYDDYTAFIKAHLERRG